MTTALSITATPGPGHSFIAKTPSGGKGSDRFTDLAVTATPSGLRTFIAKTPASGGGKPSTRWTDLTVWATPGGLRVFDAKTAAEIVEVEAQVGGGGGMYPRDAQVRARILREDEEILAVIMAYTLH